MARRSMTSSWRNAFAEHVASREETAEDPFTWNARVAKTWEGSMPTDPMALYELSLAAPNET